MELFLKVDRKGRVLIPAEVRRLIGLKDVAKARVEEGKLILESVRNLVEELTTLVVDKSGDIEEDIVELRRATKDVLRRISHGERYG